MRKMLLCVCLLVVGCGQSPKFDATSGATAEASTKAMTEGLSEADKKRLMAAMMKLSVGDAIKNVFDPKAAKSADSPADMFKSLHGMTAQEIIAKAEAK